MARIGSGAATFIAAWAATVLAAGIAAGCGGTADAAREGGPAAATAWPLLADDGSVMPSAPQALPADPAARTRSGRYATPTQAAQLEAALGDRAIWVRAEGAGAEAVESTVGIVHALLVAHDLPVDAPVLVHAADARLGAAVVERLAGEGYGRVWLVAR